MKRQRQIDESKNLVADAFLNLLTKKKFEDITLNEIADKSGVSRMTIHRHFKNKENIIAYRAGNIVSSISKKTIQDPNSSLEDTILYTLSLTKSLPNAKLLLYCDEIYYTIFGLLGDARATIRKEHFDENADEYIVEFFIGGVNAMLKKWIRNDFDKSPEELTKKIVSIIKLFKTSSLDICINDKNNKS